MEGKDEAGFNIEDTLEIQYEEYENSNEIGHLYGAGVLNYYWGDKLLAKKDLEKFVKEADYDKYKKMRRHANELLAIYDSDFGSSPE
ncbi:MAG: hypothetical protein PHI66_00030 [Candidatus Pacebacteria bacterium]|nr:hypothetical protein [Candidatus Paceibacterota bacterium]